MSPETRDGRAPAVMDDRSGMISKTFDVRIKLVFNVRCFEPPNKNTYKLGPLKHSVVDV